MTININDANFTTEVINSNKAVLVDFWAEWCGPCRMLGPIIDEVAQEMNQKVKIVKINIDENPETASQFQVRSIPFLAIFKDGKVCDVKTGVRPKEQIIEWIEGFI